MLCGTLKFEVRLRFSFIKVTSRKQNCVLSIPIYDGRRNCHVYHSELEKCENVRHASLSIYFLSLRKTEAYQLQVKREYFHSAITSSIGSQPSAIVYHLYWFPLRCRSTDPNGGLISLPAYDGNNDN